MKPIKNKYYCFGSNRVKMKFETQTKAERFIYFNSNDILLENGFAPIRTYFCETCQAWHLTSKELILKDEKNKTNKVYGKEKRIS